MQKKSVKTDHPENVQNMVLNQVKYPCIWHIFDVFSAPGCWFEAITFAWVRLLGIQVQSTHNGYFWEGTSTAMVVDKLLSLRKIMKPVFKTDRQTDRQTGSPVEVTPVPKNGR